MSRDPHAPVLPRSTPSTDLVIHERVVSELDWDSRFDPAEVGVEVDEGIVTLRGTVSSYAKLRAAADIAGRTIGVRGVVNDLIVRDDGADRDVQLADRIRLALDLDDAIPSDQIQCFVRNGHVTLRGAVDLAIERDAAEAAAIRTAGVRGLTMDVTLRGGTRADGEIEQDLRAALARRYDVVGAIDVRVENGVVALSGRVAHMRDRIAAESTAWHTRGVRLVRDEVRVIGD